MYYSKHSGIQEEMKWGNKQYSERKQSGKKNCKRKRKGAAMYWEVHSSGVHTASQAFVQDCTVVYGDRRGIASALTVLDAGAVHGL